MRYHSKGPRTSTCCFLIIVLITSILVAARLLQHTWIGAPSELPCSKRPSAWPQHIGLDSAHNYSVQQRADTGLIVGEVELKSLGGINSEMVHWLFNNLDGSAQDPRGGGSFPMYQLMHPIDHVSMIWKDTDPSTQQPTLGSKYVSKEFYGTSCDPPSSGDVPLQCSPDAKPLDCHSSSAAVTAVPSWSGPLSVTQIERGALQLVHAPMPGVQVSSITLRYSDDDNSTNTTKSLRTHIRFTVGIDNPMLAKFNKAVVLPQFAQATGGDWHLAGLHCILHAIQEFAWLPHWLPQAYAVARDNS